MIDLNLHIKQMRAAGAGLASRIHCSSLLDYPFHHVHYLDVSPRYITIMSDDLETEVFRSTKRLYPKVGSYLSDQGVTLYPPDNHFHRITIWFSFSSFMIDRIHFKSGVVLKDPIDVARHFWPHYQTLYESELLRKRKLLRE